MLTLNSKGKSFIHKIIEIQSLFFQIEINFRERDCPSVGRTQSLLVKGAKAERPQVN